MKGKGNNNKVDGDSARTTIIQHLLLLIMGYNVDVILKYFFPNLPIIMNIIFLLYCIYLLCGTIKTKS